MPARETSLLGRILGGRYRIDERVVGDGISTAYSATDQQLDRPVVVRVLAGYLSEDPLFVRRFRAEAQVAATLDHPNLVRVEDWGVESIGDSQVVYLVVEQLSGGSLQDIVDRGRLLSPSQALLIGLDVCRGLDYAHRRGVVHHDIRPSNIVFGEDRRARVANLGLARALAEDVWANPSVVEQERALYASPEQGQGRPVDERTDVYSLALTLIEAVTGQIPFRAESTVATLSARVDKLMPVSADLGPLAAVFEKAGRPDPAERSTAAQFGRALVQIAENLPRPAPIPIVGSGLFEATAPPRQRATAPPDPTAALDRPEPAGSAPALNIRETADANAPEVTGAPPADPSRPQTSHAVRWLVAALVVLALAVGGAFAYLSRPEPSHAVPALVGLTEGEAQNLVAGFDWTVTTQEEPSDSVERGNVIRTEPAQGAELRSGDDFTIVLSSGLPPSTLVDITGKSLDDANGIVTGLGLVLEVSDRPYDEKIKKGVVMSWDVPDQPGQQEAGDTVLVGTSISAVVSDGPAPREVPNLVGVKFADAQGQLEKLDLEIVRGDTVFSDKIAKGAVVTQSVSPGESVKRGSKITVTVSKGPDLVEVPKLKGLDFAGVRNALRGAGFDIGDVSGDTQGALVGAFVEGEQIKAGQSFPRGTTVDLVYF